MISFVWISREKFQILNCTNISLFSIFYIYANSFVERVGPSYMLHEGGAYL